MMQGFPMKNVCILCFLFIIVTESALPPGYEDELYCPPGCCLQHKHTRPGFSGPRSMFFDCCHVDSGQITEHPKAWGPKVSDNRTTVIPTTWQRADADSSGMCSEPSPCAHQDSSTRSKHIVGLFIQSCNNQQT